MPVHNADIAAIFDEIADLLEIEQANPFRIRAYRNAARMVGELGRELRGMVERGEDLTDLPGIGEDLAGKMREIVETGKCRALQKLQAELPPAITELLHVSGLGPKRVRMLWHELEVQTLEQLARDGRIRALPGFGAKIESNILQAVEAHLSKARSIKFVTAAQYAGSLVSWLSQARGVARVEVAGSYRRCRETVGDLDILVIAEAGSDVIARFVAYDEAAEVLSHGPTRASVVLQSGLQVDLRVVEAAAYGATLCYFTGSRAHNIGLRRLAREQGLKLNEYGVFRGRERVAGASEESVYRALGLSWIAPELREDRGEIAAARAGRLPELVQLADLRAMDHRCFTLLAHPTGRVIESRAPYDADMLRIIRHARQRGCYLELNAHPERLDLLDSHCLMAKEEGVLVAINSDAHSTDDFAHLRFGIGQARRGWLEAADVLNTRPLPELRRLLAQVRA